MAVTQSTNLADFSSGIGTAGKLDVDGHTELDNVNISGVVTSTSFVGPLIGNVTGNTSGTAGGLTGSPSITVTDLTASGNVSIAGTLTYEDVTNIDSIGLITARNGIHVTAGTVGIGTDNPVGNLEVRDSKANLIVAKDGLTVKSNSDLHTTYDLIQLGAGGALASYSVETATADTQLVHNAYRHSGGTQKYRYADTAMRLRMNSPGGTFIFESAASGSANADITFSEKLRITSAGSVGIGTDNPETVRGNNVLEVAGTTGGEVIASRNDTSMTDGDFIGGFVFKNRDAGGDPNHFGGMYAKANGTAGAMDLHFSSDRTRYESDNPDLTITNSNVGIGTDNPALKLHVEDSGSQIIRFARTGIGAGSLDIDGDGNAVFNSHTTNADVIFHTQTNERLRITSGGLVGIGTDNPGSVLDIRRAAAGSEQMLQIRSHATAAGNFNGDYSVEIRHATSTVTHGMLISNKETVNDRRTLDIADGNGVFATFTNGKVGIGTEIPSRKLHINSGTTDTAMLIESTDGDVQINFKDSDSTNGVSIGADADDFYVRTGLTTERVRINSVGDVNIGNKNHLSHSSSVDSLQIGYALNLYEDSYSSGNDNYVILGNNVYYNNGNKYMRDDEASRIMMNAGNFYFQNAAAGTAGNAITFTDVLRIHSTGYVNWGNHQSTDQHRINGINDTQGAAVLTVSGYQDSSGSTQDTAIFYAVNSSGGPNSSAAAIKIFRNDTTTRSINAAGSINTGGNDYAEYMIKAGDFTIAKGDICGINSEGKLTNVFADAVTFVVKSTDPSYVGGDTWDTAAGEEPGGSNDTRTGEELEAAKVAFKEQLEVVRQTVDRIAFCGQTPVNVTGTTPGQHIIPTANSDGSISGTAKSEGDLTLDEYMSSVGKVIAIEEDGRARIIVKVS